MPYVLGHVYLASRLSKNPQFILGNVFPDIGHLIDKETHAKMIGFAEAYYKFTGNRVFYDGVKNHFIIDGYMHPNFVFKKVSILKEKFKNVDDIVLHALIEATMDMEIAKMHPEIYGYLSSALKNFDKDGFTVYLSDYLYMDRKKIRVIIEDGFNVINNRKIYSIRNLFTKVLSLRKYAIGRNYLGNIRIRHTRKLFKTVRETVKEDYDEYLEKTVELTKKRLSVKAKNRYTFEDV